MDLLLKMSRLDFLNDIVSNENKIRKAESLAAFEIYNDRLNRYVTNYLLSQYAEKTVLEMPIISSMNLCKRIANKEASIYKECPDRRFTGNLTDDQKDMIHELYEESEINSKLFKSNVYFKIQGQNFLKVMPKDKKLEVKCLLPHHLDVVPDSVDPEKASAYVVSSFDKKQYIKTDGINQKIADADDYQAAMNKYIVWDNEKNFMFNGLGNIEGEIVDNPIGTMPFIDVSGDKDFEFFVRVGQTLVDFTIQYNGALSDLAQVVKMQGWAVGVLKAPPDMVGLKSLTIGVNKVLHLPIDPNNPLNVAFEYVSANPDVAGSIQHVENLLSNFLTSRGLDPSLVNGKAQAIKYNSGTDRLLSMIDQFESTKQDLSVYKGVENKLFDLIKRWSQVTFGTDAQFLPFAIPDDAGVDVDFHEPSLIESKAEQLDYVQKKMELGLMTKVDALEEVDDLSKEEAIKKLAEIDQEIGMVDAAQANIIAGQSSSGN